MEYIESTGLTGQIGNMSISQRSSASVRQYQQDIETADDIYEIIQEVLGYTKYEISNDGRMARQPPLADPILTMTFAEKIGRIQGLGKAVRSSDGNPEIEVPVIGDYSEYSEVLMEVGFTSRQYAVLPDYYIDLSEGTWTPDINQDGTSTPQTFSWANEWTRYTECSPITPTGDYLTQQGGSIMGTMFFNSSGRTPNPNGQQCAFMPSVRVPDFRVSLIWHCVPLRYITSQNSYIANKNWQNRVNQNAIRMPWNGPGDSCPPGTLLFVDYSYVSYTPATGFIANPYNNGTFSEKMVDITLNFIYTTRRLASGESPAVSPTNANYVVGGHNLLYWNGDFLPHYANLKTTGGDLRPVYISAPLEMLQNDPDAVGAI